MHYAESHNIIESTIVYQVSSPGEFGDRTTED
jgi:hypothetical protein